MLAACNWIYGTAVTKLILWLCIITHGIIESFLSNDMSHSSSTSFRVVIFFYLKKDPLENLAIILHTESSDIYWSLETLKTVYARKPVS